MQILLIARDEEIETAVRQALTQGMTGHVDVVGERSIAEAEPRLARQHFDCVLLAVDPAPRWLRDVELVAKATRAPLIVLAARELVAEGANAIKAGADDFVIRHARIYGVLRRIVLYAVERHSMQKIQLQQDLQVSRLQRVCAGLMEHMEQGVLVLEPGGRIAEANRRAQDLLGLSSRKLVGTELLELLAISGRRRFAAYLNVHEREERSAAQSFVFDLEAGPRSLEIELHPLEGGREDLGGAAMLVLLRGADEKRGALTAGAIAEGEALEGEFVPVAVYQLIGLENLRRRLGTGWAAMESRVRELVERTLLKALGDPSRYWKNHDGNYLVVFHAASIETAEEQAAAIQRQIEQAVLGAGSEHGESVDESGLSAEELHELGTVEMSVHAVDIGKGEIAPDETSRQIAERLDAMRKAERSRNMQLVNELYIGAKGDYVTAQGRDSQLSRLQLLRHDPAVRDTIARLRKDAREDLQLMFELDSFILSSHVELIMEDIGWDDLMAVVDISYRALATASMKERYIALLERLPEKARKSIVFNLVDIEPGTYLPKLTRIAGSLAPYSVSRAFQVTQLRQDVLEFWQAQMRLVVIDIDDLTLPLHQDPDLVRGFVERAHQAQCRVLVRRVAARQGAHLRNEFLFDLTSIG